MGSTIQKNNTDEYIYSLKNYDFKNKTIIDVGCGTAYASSVFINLGAKKVLGVDIKKPKNILTHDKFEFYSNLNDVSEKVDYIWTHHCIEHVYQPIDFLKNIFQLLKDDGVLIIGCPNQANNKDIQIFSPGHIHNYTLMSLAEQIEIAGFGLKGISWWIRQGQLRIRISKNSEKGYPNIIQKQMDKNTAHRVHLADLPTKFNW